MTDVGRDRSAPMGTYLGGDIFKALNTSNDRHKSALYLQTTNSFRSTLIGTLMALLSPCLLARLSRF
jgi:hypothetical protein